MRRPPAPTVVVVPRRCTLDGFAEEVSQTSGVDLTTLDPITTLLVRTANSLYRITVDRKSTRLNSSHIQKSRMPSSA